MDSMQNDVPVILREEIDGFKKAVECNAMKKIQRYVNLRVNVRTIIKEDREFIGGLLYKYAKTVDKNIISEELKIISFLFEYGLIIDEKYFGILHKGIREKFFNKKKIFYGRIYYNMESNIHEHINDNVKHILINAKRHINLDKMEYFEHIFQYSIGIHNTSFLYSAKEQINKGYCAEPIHKMQLIRKLESKIEKEINSYSWILDIFKSSENQEKILEYVFLHGYHEIIDKAINLEIKNEKILNLAIEKRNNRLVEKMIRLGCSKEKALIYAVRIKNSSLVKCAIGLRVNIEFNNNYAISLAAFHENKEIVLILADALRKEKSKEYWDFFEKLSVLYPDVGEIIFKERPGYFEPPVLTFSARPKEVNSLPYGVENEKDDALSVIEIELEQKEVSLGGNMEAYSPDRISSIKSPDRITTDRSRAPKVPRITLPSGLNVGIGSSDSPSIINGSADKLTSSESGKQKIARKTPSLLYGLNDEESFSKLNSEGSSSILSSLRTNSLSDNQLTSARSYERRKRQSKIQKKMDSGCGTGCTIQ